MFASMQILSYYLNRLSVTRLCFVCLSVCFFCLVVFLEVPVYLFSRLLKIQKFQQNKMCLEVWV